MQLEIALVIVGYKNKIITGDCRSELSNIPEEFIDLTVTSPPYNIQKEYTGYDDNLTISEWKSLIQVVFEELFRITKPDGKVVINIGKSFSPTDTAGRFYFHPLAAFVKIAALESGFDFFDEAIWNKSGYHSRGGGALMGSYPSPTNMMITQIHEHILVFRKWCSESYFSSRQLPPPGSDIRERSKVSKERWRDVMQSIWNFRGVQQSELDIDHSAVYPEEIPKRAIQFYSFREDTVLDPFAGLGTTGLAAKRSGRSYILIEQSERYAEYATDRISKAEPDSYSMEREGNQSDSKLSDYEA